MWNCVCANTDCSVFVITRFARVPTKFQNPETVPTFSWGNTVRLWLWQLWAQDGRLNLPQTIGFCAIGWLLVFCTRHQQILVAHQLTPPFPTLFWVKIFFFVCLAFVLFFWFCIPTVFLWWWYLTVTFFGYTNKSNVTFVWSITQRLTVHCSVSPPMWCWKLSIKVYYGHTAILLSLFLAIVLFFVYLKSYWLMSFGNDAFCTKKKHNVMHKILNLHCNRKSWQTTTTALHRIYRPKILPFTILNKVLPVLVFA